MSRPKESLEFDANKIAKVLMLQFAFPEAYDYFHRYPELLEEAQALALLSPEDRKMEPDGIPSAVWWRMGEREAEEAPSVLRDPRLLLALGTEPPLTGDDAERYVRLSGRVVSEGAALSPGGTEVDLVRDLLSGDYPVISAAAERVKNLGEAAVKASVASLAARLKDEDWSARGSAAAALGNIGAPEGIQPLVGALNDEHPHVRWRAAYALGNIGAPEGVQHLIGALKDKDMYVRERAAKALGGIGSEEALPALREVADSDSDKDGSGRYYAREAMRKIEAKRKREQGNSGGDEPLSPS